MLSNTKRKGFTLIELLIVVVIIGILAAVAIPKFASTKDKAKLSSVKTDMRNIMSHMEGLASESGSYPTTAPAAATLPLSADNTAAFSATTASGYTLTITNSTISTGSVNSCTVSVGAAAATPADDGKITC